MSNYYVFNSENGKTYLSIDADSQMGVALGKVQASLTKEMGFQFKPPKSKIYICIPQEQASNLPKHQNLLISINLYGVFLQSSSNTAFLQFELTGYKTTSKIDFDAIINPNDNAVFP